MKFSHLHNHTQYSLLDGASNIARLYDKARKSGMPAIAITDHGNMYGVFDFVAEAWKKKKVVGQTPDGKNIEEPEVKPVVGCEFYLVENRHKRQFSKDDKDQRFHQLMLAKNEIGYKNLVNPVSKALPDFCNLFHFLLAKNEIGYKNLVKLCSLGFMEGLYGKYPRIDKELILQYHEGLIATTCCLGAEVPRTILRKGEAAAEIVFKWWLDLFGDDYFVELQRHDIPEQNKVNEVLVRFARKYNVPIIASNDSHYVDVEDYKAHDILLCVNTGAKIGDPKYKEIGDDDEVQAKNARFAFYNDQFFFKTPDQMTQLFADLPEAIDNTNLVLDKIKPLKLERDILLPHFKVPIEFNDDQNAYLAHLTWEGARERYKEITAEVEDRLKFELFTISTMGFAGYFLIVSDFIKAGRDLGVFIGPGRGSAAGSAVAYCIGITNIDPIKYKLLFERFLNPDRKSMPDIDTDFDDVGRQKVIDYVVKKYGRNQVAHIVTYGTMAAKSSIKDVARALDLPLPESNALAKLVPEKPGITLKRLLHAALKGEGSLEAKEGISAEDHEAVLKLREIYGQDTLHSEVLHSAEKLEGSVRNTGIHAAGIIIAPQDLSELLPVCTTKDVDLLITQYEGNVIENAGVIKMDFLGLKTLTIIKDALELIKLNYDLVINIDLLPLDDKATYELYQAGETNGTFQFESPGMQKHLINLKPDKFDDLIAMNALYRPGPIEYIPNYIKRKHGQEAITYDVPEMAEYLADTYGITVYQEQVMLLSQSLAGFSKGDADVLRKAMGKKQKSVLDKMKGQFVEGAVKKGHPQDKLQKIWTDWEAFAQYAFNKSHSTCYALVAYQTAYLKAHYPAEYMAAVLNNQGNIEKIKFYMEECQRMGLQVLGPDVNESLKGFAVAKEGVIRFGLNALKGVGEAAVEDIIAERRQGGQFTTVYDFIKRVNQRTVNKKSLESLVLGGAFDCFPQMHRAQYFFAPPTDPVTGMERLVRFGNQFQASSSVATNSLFGAATMPEVKPPLIPECEKWGLPELLDKEKEVVGIYLSAHPLDGFRFEMENYGMTPVNELENNKGRSIRIAGFVTDAGHMTSKKGTKFGKMTINDYSGSYEIMFWEKSYVQYGNYLVNGQKLMLQGTYDNHKYREGVTEFSVNNIMLLDDVRKLLTRKVNISIPLHVLTLQMVEFLRDNIKRYPGSTELFIHVADNDTNYSVRLRSQNQKFELNDDLIYFLRNTEGIKFIIDKA
jgi:DNA polymerase-3 subunit alpha